MAAAVAIALVGMHAAMESSENSNILMEPRLPGRHGNCRRRWSSVRYLIVSPVVIVSDFVTTGRIGTSCMHDHHKSKGTGIHEMEKGVSSSSGCMPSASTSLSDSNSKIQFVLIACDNAAGQIEQQEQPIHINQMRTNL
jgi:hypothetical protein